MVISNVEISFVFTSSLFHVFIIALTLLLPLLLLILVFIYSFFSFQIFLLFYFIFFYYYYHSTLYLPLCSLSCVWGCSSDGRAFALHARGSGIDARHLHFFLRFIVIWVSLFFFSWLGSSAK